MTIRIPFGLVLVLWLSTGTMVRAQSPTKSYLTDEPSSTLFPPSVPPVSRVNLPEDANPSQETFPSLPSPTFSDAEALPLENTPYGTPFVMEDSNGEEPSTEKAKPETPGEVTLEPIETSGMPWFIQDQGYAPQRSSCFWINGEWLYWTMQGAAVPALVTSNPAGTALDQIGLLGAPSTTVLFGDNIIGDGLNSGFRFSGGVWLDRNESWGIEGSFFYLDPDADSFLASSTGDPILSRPFFNIFDPFLGPTAPFPDAELVSFPGVLAGSIQAEYDTMFLGAEANLRKKLCSNCWFRLDGLFGYRYLRLEDDLFIRESLEATDPFGFIPVGTQIEVEDTFSTTNNFHGGQIGTVARFQKGRLWFDVVSKLAIGVSNQEVVINGRSSFQVPGEDKIVEQGGLLAQRSNIGTFNRNNLAIVPEINLKLGYRISDHLHGFVGYTFLYWSQVTRAGEQIDLTVNTSQLPPGELDGPARPGFSDRQSDFWAHGLNLGLEFRW